MRQGLAALLGALVFVALAAAPASATHRGCGFLGLSPCPHTAPAPTLPEPGGDHTADVPNVPAGRLFGFSSVGFWRSNYGVDVADEVRVLRAAGGNFFRTPLHWKDVQPNRDGWDEGGWETYAKLVRALREYDPDVTILFQLSYAPNWAALGECSWLTLATCLPRRPPAKHALDEFAAYASEIVRRFDNPATPRVEVAIETWNEPNLDAFWEPYGPDPHHMTNMQCAVYERVKADHPRAIVTSAAINGTIVSTNGNISMGTYLDKSYSYGLKGCMDKVNVHLAPKPASEFPNGQWSKQWVQLKDVMAKWGDFTGDLARDRRIWVTETNAGTSGDKAFTPAEQLERLKAVHAKLFTMDTVPGDDGLPVMVEQLSIHTTLDTGTEGKGVAYGAPWFRPKPVLCHFNSRAATSFVYPGC